MTDSAGSPARSARQLLVLVAVVAVASACTSDGATTAGGQVAPTSAEARISSLQEVSQLRDRFDANAGKVRLVLLLSPT